MKHNFREIRSKTVAVSLAVLVFFVVNLAASEMLSQFRLDFTENKLYALTQGTENILSELDDPITLTYFVSKSSFEDVPPFRVYARRIEDLLKEYERRAAGKINLRIVHPESFSEEEDVAVGYGLESFPNRDGVAGYLGLVAFNSVGQTRVIPFFYPEREELLEYDVTRMIFQLTSMERKKVGIISALPLRLQATASAQAWHAISDLENFFDVEYIAVSETEIPADIATLILIHPANYSEDLLYTIDQFALRGGGLMLLVDPHSELLASMMPIAGLEALEGSSSDLNQLTKNWGVQLEPGKIVGDLPIAARVRERDDTSGQLVDYPVWMNMQPEQFDTRDVVTANLANIVIATGGVIAIDSDTELDVYPLISSAESAKIYATEEVISQEKIRDLLIDYEPGGIKMPLAVRIAGRAESSFDGPPHTQSAIAESESPDHLESGRISVIMVADTDFLQDRFWIRTQRILGRMVSYAEASNGDFFNAAVDNLSGGKDLRNLRSRGRSSRPFSRIQAVRQEAERQYLEQESKLIAELRRTENLLFEFRGSQNEGQTGLMLTEEQRNEFEQIRLNQIEIRKQLRQVRHNLNESIDAIESKIKLLNFLVMPIAVAMFGVAMVAYAARRRESKLVVQVARLLE